MTTTETLFGPDQPHPPPADGKPTLYTSCFANAATLAVAGVTPVAIARGKPRGWKYASYDALAPTWAMLKMGRADYDRAYAAILAKLDPRAVFDELLAGRVGGVAILCWEKPGTTCCHRRQAAEWFEAALGVTVTEFGYDRSAVRRYAETPWPAKASA